MNSTGTSGGVSENFSRYALSKAAVSAARVAACVRAVVRAVGQRDDEIEALAEEAAVGQALEDARSPA